MGATPLLSCQTLRSRINSTTTDSKSQFQICAVGYGEHQRRGLWTNSDHLGLLNMPIINVSTEAFLLPHPLVGGWYNWDTNPLAHIQPRNVIAAKIETTGRTFSNMHGSAQYISQREVIRLELSPYFTCLSLLHIPFGTRQMRRPKFYKSCN